MKFPPILDNHNRPINYVRLAVTDRCNLRCFYCMPETGIKYLPKLALLSYEEMERLLTILAQMGITKVRITGGEPFVRRDLVPFMQRVSKIVGIEQIHLTTNGVFTADYLPELKAMGIASVNLSLDTLDNQRFKEITRRDDFAKVMQTFEGLLAYNIPTKINAVIMAGKNTEDIIPLTELTRQYPVSVRFIEEMPFNGEGLREEEPLEFWNYRRILAKLQAHYPQIYKIPDGNYSTSYNYAIPNHQGTVGIIAAFSRTFCGTCNRIRVTAQGTLKTCLYDDGVLDIKKLMRNGATDEDLAEALLYAFQHRPKDGFEAEQQRANHAPVSESMSTIGG
jgi:molybdenum cofactor biosynthesis protein A